MKSFRMILSIAVLGVLITNNSLQADEVWLKNGSRIKGVVVTTEEEKLIFKTTFAGDMAITWAEITNLSTDAPIKVLFIDGTTAQGVVFSGEAGKISMKSEQIETPMTFNLAQVKGVNPPPAVTFKGRVNIGVNITQGNTDSKTYYGDAKIIAKSEVNRFTLGGRYNYAEDDDHKTEDNQTGYIQYDHFLTDKWYFLANAAGTKDDFKDLNLRSSAGLGMGYQFIETKKTNLSLELGPSYVNNDYIVADDDSYAAGRWAVNFDHFLYKNFIQFFHDHVGLISLSDTSDLFVQSQTGFRFTVYQGLNATAQLNFDWDNAPSPGIDNTDEAYLFTLGYQF